MARIFVLPTEFVMEMDLIRREKGISVKEQIIEAIKGYLNNSESYDLASNRSSLIFKQIDDRSYGVFNTKTRSFHDPELGIDILF